MAFWLRRVTASLATWILLQQGAETLFSPLAILCGTEPGVSELGLTLALLILLCSLLFFSEFHLW